MPASQAAGTAWPFGAGGTPRITITTTRTPPAQVDRQQLMRVLVIVGAFVAMGFLVPTVLSFSFIGSLFGSGGTDEVAVGETAKVMSFEATVRGVDCTKQEITKPDDPATPYDDSSTEKAKGKFCVVSFSVKNVGEKTDSYPTWGFEATSPTERVFDRSTTAEGYVNNGKRGLDEPIDPGKTVDQLLVFDVPTDTTLAYLQICDDVGTDSAVKVKFGS
ncbi:DUF4352 domain-containing protein [Krasilnikovia sp. MM14-A1004]|uniref:DUF4352 domain-containing protein n=1 Tax=Krasilnikovia sp. MM14-A1004 TaxID=3373541 RepID=UPI00399C7DEE